MTYPCPYCDVPASAATGCPACGRGPDRDALEVIRLDGVITELTARLTAARLAAQQTEQDLAHARVRRNAAAARVRDAVSRFADVRGPAAPAAAEAVSDPSREKHPVPPSRETSTRLIQNTLFLLGGLLLAVAAIVFTAVAWAQFGLGGRAVLLALFTGATLAVPLVARRRDLVATAETFAAVGLLLIVLDGYAAWYVDLLGVDAASPWAYAAAVCAVTAVVAAGYQRVTGLAGPRYAALLIAQPVLPLLLAPTHPNTAGWAYVYAGVALLDLTVLLLARGALRFVAATLGAFAALTTAAAGTAALLAAPTPARAALAGCAVVLAALLPLTAAIRLRRPIARSVLAGTLVITVAAAATRAAVLLAPAHALMAASLALLAVAVLAATARSVWPANPTAGVGSSGRPAAQTPHTPGTATSGVLNLGRPAAQTHHASAGEGVRGGTAIALAPAAMIAAVATAHEAVETLRTAPPPLAAVLSTTVPGTDRTVPLVLAVLAAAIAITVPPSWRRLVVLLGGAFAVLAVPAALHLPWWSATLLDLTGAAAALFLASRFVAVPAAERPTSADTIYGVQILTALALTGHGVAAGFGTPAAAAGALAGLSTLGLALAARTRRGPRRLDLAGPGLLVGLLTWPAVAWATTAALTSAPLTQSRVALAAAMLPTVFLHLFGRRLRDLRPFALTASLIPAVIAPLWAYPAGDSVALYAGVVLLALATLAGDRATWFAAVLPAVAFLTATAVPLFRVLAAAYANLADIWSGERATWPVPASAPIAFLLLTAAVATVQGRRRATIEPTAPIPAAPIPAAPIPADLIPAALIPATPILAVTVALTLAAAHAPWPLLPAAELLFGLAGLLSVALRPARGLTAYASVVFALLAGAGLAGALPTRPATLVALGAVLIAGAVAGVAGRALPARPTGWLAAVAAALGAAVTAVDLHRIAFPILAVAAATLALSWLLHSWNRPAESRTIEVAAHATAVLALLVALGSLHTTAAICTLWGIFLGLRALRPDQRDGHLIAAAVAEFAAWAQLMTVAQVGTLEAYSIPAAAVALLAGVRGRRRTGLSSWVAYGPALAAALLPSLGSILVSDGQHLRRLLLGLAALAVLLAGARTRLQAPVVLGGGVLALVALHEIAQVWDLLPRWLPLAAGGMLLVLLAMTLERRRRDFDRIRTALTRMG